MEDPSLPITGEVPDDLLELILADAAERTTTPVDELVIVRSEQVVWPDGSLGCPEPGTFYTQAIVDGYRVEVEGGGTTLDYRASNNGSFKLCPGLRRP